jgi:hypothetical protein
MQTRELELDLDRGVGVARDATLRGGLSGVLRCRG